MMFTIIYDPQSFVQWKKYPGSRGIVTEAEMKVH